MLDEAAAREAAALRTYTLGGGTRIEAAITNEISSRHGVGGDMPSFPAVLADVMGANGAVATHRRPPDVDAAGAGDREGPVID